MMEFYPELSREILQYLRGTKSQSDLSEMLGYSFNQVGKWETGATAFHWEDFERLCEVLELPLKRNFEEVFSFHTGMRLGENSLFEILSRFFGHASVTEMAERLGKSRSSISRLIHDQVKIDFADVLRLMDQRPFVLSSWLAKFVDLSKIPSLKERAAVETKTVQGLLMVPWAGLVNSALGLTEYAKLETHSSQLLARKTGLSVEMVDIGLRALVEGGLIELRNGKYANHVREMTFLRVPEFRKVTQFLGRMITEAFQEKPASKPNIQNPSLSASRFYPLSDASGKKIAEALVRFHHEVSEIIKHDEGPKTHVRALLIHSLDLELLSTAHDEKRQDVAVSERRSPELAQ